jgi:hypothetical protein
MRCEALCRDWRKARAERRSRIAPGLTAVNGLGWPRSLDRTSLHREFPANRKNTGKFTKAGSLSGPERSNYPMFWGLSSELPIKSNRELLEGKQGNHFRTQGILLEIAPALLLQSSPQIGRWHRLAVTGPRAVISRRATRPSDRGRLGRPNRRSQSKFGIKHPEACQASYRTSPGLFIRPAEKATAGRRNPHPGACVPVQRREGKPLRGDLGE